MTFDAVFQGLVISLSTVSLYLLMALGLTLMFGVMQILNFAHGAVYMVGAFSTYYLVTSAGIPFWPSLAIAAAATAILGLLVERGLFRPTEHSFQATVLIFIALMWAMEAGGGLGFGLGERYLPTPITGVSEIFGARISSYRLILIPIVAGLTGGVYYLIYRTRAGLVLRATEENQEAAALQGVSVHRVHALVFALGFGLAGLAGGLIGPLVGATPVMGLTPLLKAFVIVAVGGLGSVTGTVIAAILIGLMDGIVTVAIGGVEAELLSYFLVILVLLVRPRGLMGRF